VAFPQRKRFQRIYNLKYYFPEMGRHLQRSTLEYGLTSLDWIAVKVPILRMSGGTFWTCSVCMKPEVRAGHGRVGGGGYGRASLPALLFESDKNQSLLSISVL